MQDTGGLGIRRRAPLIKCTKTYGRASVELPLLIRGARTPRPRV
jgi:hypothetical protein